MPRVILTLLCGLVFGSPGACAETASASCTGHGQQDATPEDQISLLQSRTEVRNRGKVHLAKAASSDSAAGGSMKDEANCKCSGWAGCLCDDTTAKVAAKEMPSQLAVPALPRSSLKLPGSHVVLADVSEDFEDSASKLHDSMHTMEICISAAVSIVIVGILFWCYIGATPKEPDEPTALGQVQEPWHMRYPLLVSASPILALFLIGALVFMFTEGWTFTSAMYVSTQIITTVGYGDLTAQSDTTRWFMTFYVLAMIVFAASAMSDLAESISDQQGAMIRNQLSSVGSFSLRGASTSGSQEQKAPEEQAAPVPAPKARNDWVKRYHIKQLLTSIFVFMCFVMTGAVFYSTFEGCSCSYGVTKASNYAGCIDSGPDNNCATKGVTKSFSESFYMSVITLTTVGFGDFTPESRLGRILSIFWMVLGIVSTGNMVTAIAMTKSAMMSAARNAARDEEALLANIDVKNTGQLTRAEFLQYMLVHNGMIKQEDVDHIDQIFRSLDTESTGKVGLKAAQKTAIAEDDQTAEEDEN